MPNPALTQPESGSPRPKTSDCLRLSVADVPTRTRGSTRLPTGQEALIRIDPTTVRLVRSRGLIITDISLATATTPSGGVQTLFRCPLSGERSRILYVDGDRIGTASALGLAYPSQSRSPVSRALIQRDKLMEQLANPRLGTTRRQALAERLAKASETLARTDHADWSDAVALEEQARILRDRRRRIRVISPPPLSSRAAMLKGRRQLDRPSSCRICKNLDYLLALGMPKWEAPSGLAKDRQPSSNFPYLDIRDFVFGQGHADGRLLVWPETPEGRVVVRARMDDSKSRLIIRVDSPQVSTWVQVIQIVGGRRSADRFMVCPINGTRHLQLYFRSGIWASRTAHALMTTTEWERRRKPRGR